MFKKIRHDNGIRDIYFFNKKIFSYVNKVAFAGYIANKCESVLSHVEYQYNNKDELDNIQLLMNKLYVSSHYRDVFFDMYLQDGEKICIDGGAHHGWFSDLVLACGGTSYAFEPNIYLFKMLKNKYINESKVHLYNNALGGGITQLRLKLI